MKCSTESAAQYGYNFSSAPSCTDAFLSHGAVTPTGKLDQQQSEGLSSSIPPLHHNSTGGFWPSWSNKGGDFGVAQLFFHVFPQEAAEHSLGRRIKGCGWRAGDQSGGEQNVFDEFNSRHVLC